MGASELILALFTSLFQAVVCDLSIRQSGANPRPGKAKLWVEAVGRCCDSLSCPTTKVVGLEFGLPDLPFDGAALLNPSGVTFELA